MSRGLPKEAGYAHGVDPGLLPLYEKCRGCGINEISIYGFTRDNTRRPTVQKQAFSDACVTFAFDIALRGAALLVVGDDCQTISRSVKTIPATPGRRHEGESAGQL